MVGEAVLLIYETTNISFFTAVKQIYLIQQKMPTQASADYY